MQEAELKIQEKFQSIKAKKLYVPKRYILVLLGFLGMFNAYAMRVNLSVAMVAMVNQTAISLSSPNRSYHQEAECSNLIHDKPKENYKEGFKGDQYNWDSKTQGKILGSFFYGYIVSQIPGGMLSERFGSKWLYGGGILMASVLCLLTPLATSWGTAAFVVVRVLQGLSEGVTFPAVNFAISTWSPTVERSRISTVIVTGAQIGNVISMPISGLLCSTDLFGGWPSVFYVFGSMGVIWFVFWGFLIHEKPSEHPGISKEELLYIEQSKEENPQKKSALPWKCIITSVPFWALLFAHIGHCFGFLILLTEIPTYLSTILHFDIKANGFLSAVLYIAQAVTAWIASYIADKLRETKKMSITNIRKMCNSIGEIGPALCLIGVCAAGCHSGLIVILLSLAMALNGFVFSGFSVTHVDMCPEYAGTLFAITNLISNISGILGPMIVGAFTASGATLKNWSYVFYITAAVYIVCGVIFALFGSADLQNWGLAKDDATKEEKSENKIHSTEIRNGG